MLMGLDYHCQKLQFGAATYKSKYSFSNSSSVNALHTLALLMLVRSMELGRTSSR